MSFRSYAIPVLAAASATQCAASAGLVAFDLYAPRLAAETGLNARDFGVASTFMFAGAFLASPLTGAIVRRWGAAGAMMRAFAFMAGAMLLVLGGTWATMMAAALLFGIGYAPQGAIGMTMVTQNVAPSRRGLALALRHAAAPMGAAVISRSLPPLMLLFGWQAGVLSLTGVLLAALVFTALREAIFRIEASPPRYQNNVERFRGLLTIPPGLHLLWGAGLVFAMTQTALTAFAYFYLLEVAHVSALAGGVFLSNAYLTALFGRPLLGWLTDRTGKPGLVLAGAAAMAVLAVLTLLQVGSETPLWLLVPLAIGCGIAGQCWNPVFGVAMSFRIAPGDLAEMNGRAFGVLSLGWTVAPSVIWVLIEITGGYTVPMAGIAVLNLIMAGILLATAGRLRPA